MRSTPPAAALGLILAVYLGLGVATVVTRTPWQDEAWFGSPAYNLAYNGFLGTTILDPKSSTWKKVDLTGIDRHTYWVMPLSLLLNAADFRVLGFGSVQMRLPALFFGALFLLAWWYILRWLEQPRELVWLAVFLIAVDYHFQMQAADGRMDAMAIGLGYAGIAAYLWLRGRSFLRAIAISHVFTAAAFFTHPNGALPEVLLAVTILTYDRKRLRGPALAVAATPFVLLSAGWALYIAQAPSDWRAQILGNAAERGPTISAPLLAIRAEIEDRYLNSFGMAKWSRGSGRLNIVPLLLLLAGTLFCVCSGSIRRDPAYRLLLLWTGITICYLTWFEGLKTHFYLIYVTPLYSVLTAIAIYRIWINRARWRVPLAAATAILMVLQMGRTAVIAARLPKSQGYSAAAQYLREHFDRTTFTMGNGSLMFALGPDWNLLDDFRLGYNSGKHPAVIVVDDVWSDRMNMLEQQHPAIWTHVQNTLQAYTEVYKRGGYRILVPKIAGR